jgi:hypothetical protein
VVAATISRIVPSESLEIMSQRLITPLPLVPKTVQAWENFLFLPHAGPPHGWPSNARGCRRPTTVRAFPGRVTPETGGSAQSVHGEPTRLSVINSADSARTRSRR